MKKKLISMMLVVTLILTACGSEEPKNEADPNASNDTVTEAAAEEKSDGTWAIYWYLCGSDLESNGGFATDDLNELTSVQLPDNVKFVIQTGGAKTWQNEMMSADSIGRYEYTSEDFKQVDELEQANMGDGDTLKDFLAFCNENYPADHKMVLFWDHGGGTPSGAALDENYDGDALSLPEIRKAFEETCEVSADNPPYDIIGFDTCLMATVDVANIFKDVSKYLVGSEETEPGIGWCYDGWVGALAKDTTISPADLGKTICDTYYKACEQNEFADEATLSVTDLSKIDPVLSAYNALGDEALVNLVQNDSFAGKFHRAAKEAENYGGNTDKSGYSDMADMGDLAINAAELLPNSSQAVVDAIKDAVVYQVKGKFRSKANGLSCYVSYSYDTDLLKKYTKASGTEAFDYYYTFNLTEDINDKGYQYIMNLLNGEEIKEKEPFNIESLKDKKLKIENGDTAVLKIGGKNASQLSAINYDLYLIDDDGETFIGLGSAGTAEDITADWDKGIFKENFRGVWGAIDGELVYMEVANKNDEYTTYQVPIKLNDEELFLSVACDNSTHEYTILGAQEEMENGLSSKDIKKLKPGDKVTPILFACAVGSSDVKEFENNTITVTEDTKFTEEELGDGNYALDFEMVSNKGEKVSSDVEIFKVKGNNMKYL